MDCNKVEAVKAKEVAETKLLEKDSLGAKKFALKAQGLFPELDGLSQFLEIVDVHVAQDNTINGEVDYYGIFGVDPFANEVVLKKQYKRMALTLHPDKNKSVGADGAFKILSQAWSVLSDVDQRTAYNSRLSNVSAPNQATCCKYTRPGTQGTFASGAYVSRNPGPPIINQHIPSRNPPKPIPGYQQHQTRVWTPFHQQYAPFIRPQTFWMTCDRCSMHYEYKKIYLNQNLLCSCCQQPYLATETPHAPKASNHSYQQHVFAGSRSVPSGEHLKSSSTIPEEMKAAPASNTVGGQNREKQPVKKRRRNSHAGGEVSDCKSGVKRASAKVNMSFGANKRSSVKELSQAEIRAMLMRNAKKAIIGQIKECESEESKRSSHVKVEIKKDAISHAKTEERGNGLSRDTKNTLQPNKFFTPEETDDIDVNIDETVSMMVPDANFHNFSDDRVEESFSENQIWAAYDDDDGMPRYFDLVPHVISRKPFKMQISWLNSKSTSEIGSLEWIGSGFTKTHGDFRVGKCKTGKRLISFSHPVKLVVLEDYNEDVGVLVAPLVKVFGLTSMFNLDQRGTHTIPREETFRFSHQFPFQILNGQEAENATKGCYELDPAALTLELLRVISDAEAAEERVSEHPVMLCRSGEAVRHGAFQRRSGVEEGKNILTYSRRKGSNEDGKVSSLIAQTEEYHGTTEMVLVHGKKKISGVADGRFCISNKNIKEAYNFIFEKLKDDEIFIEHSKQLDEDDKEFIEVIEDDAQKIVMIGKSFFAMFYGNVVQAKQLIVYIEDLYNSLDNMRETLTLVRTVWASKLIDFEKSHTGICVAGFENEDTVVEWFGKQPITRQFEVRNSKMTIYFVGQGKTIAEQNFFLNRAEISEMTDSELIGKMESSAGIASVFSPYTGGNLSSIILEYDGEVVATYGERHHAIVHLVKHFATVRPFFPYGVILVTSGINTTNPIEEYSLQCLLRLLLGKISVVILATSKEKKETTRFVCWTHKKQVPESKSLWEVSCSCARLMFEIFPDKDLSILFREPTKDEFENAELMYNLK